MDLWREERVLILGKTYSVQSTSHDELNCTGGILESTSAMVRLHPISWRELDPGGRPRDFHWIRVQVREDRSDTRPESLQINPSTIVLDGSIPASKKEERRKWLDCCTHAVRSVEELQDLQRTVGRSLGIVRPKSIRRCFTRRKRPAEEAEWQQKEERRRSQPDLDGRRPPPIDFIGAEFRVEWVCDDERCTGHDMALFDFGIHQLWRRLAGDSRRDGKVVQKMEQMLDTARWDVYLFLGNVKTRPRQFILAGAESIPKREQSLFD